MRKHCHLNNIHHVRVNHLSGGASINYGPSIHKNLQANVKINTGEFVIGDEITLGYHPIMKKMRKINLVTKAPFL
ncbi:hypothetical protein QGM71_06410 [Virgibacillus sp. C22-A2]|uniref:Uncharacterized protein n=1 Tax=Virgibacillus tibetensis TaxID=3042313 RepID=A0ABU6KCS4_9BACI|nr:hypothetical protein [Virgibacillus sp. C22-A2]